MAIKICIVIPVNTRMMRYEYYDAELDSLDLIEICRTGWGIEGADSAQNRRLESIGSFFEQ